MSKNGTYKPKENTGTLFYDVPGVPTMRGSIQSGSQIDVQAEPATDKNQKEYTRITGDNINGALYANEDKPNEKYPDFSGPISIKGKEMRVAAWKKEIRTGENAGNEFLSLSISEKLPPKSN